MTVAVISSPLFSSGIGITLPSLKIWRPRAFNWSWVNFLRTPSVRSSTVTELNPCPAPCRCAAR